MIVNDGDLLPLGARPATAAKAPPGPEPDMFSTRVAETYDSIELLLAARAEAEEAETQAKQVPETVLPYVKEDKKKAKHEEPHGGGGATYGVLRGRGAADDDELPGADRDLGGADLRRLSDATGEEMGTSLKDFLRPDRPRRARARSDRAKAGTPAGGRRVRGRDPHPGRRPH